MNKETKLTTVIIVIFIFSIQLLLEKSYQSIFPNINEKNNNNNYFGNLKIIEKNANKEEVKDEIKYVGEEQVPIKQSETNNNKDDGKIIIKNEIREGNTNLKIINSNIDKNQSNESILKIQ